MRAALVAAVAFFAVILFGVLFTLRTRNGTLVIKSDDPNVQVAVKQNGKVVEVVNAQSGWKISLKSGQYELAPQGSTDQFKLDPEKVTVERGGVAIVKLTLKTNLSDFPPPAVAPFDAAKAKEHQAAWAKHLGVPVEITNSIGMKLVLIPPGEFDMGSTPEEIARELEYAQHNKISNKCLQGLPSEVPRHRVKITKPFCLAMCPVTQAEYESVMGANPSNFTEKQVDVSSFNPSLSEADVKCRLDSYKLAVGKDTSRHPVEKVNWDEAMEFCRKLSAVPTERAARHVYRLPTEAEWEYACRAGTTTRWFCGDDEAGVADVAWIYMNSGGMTHPAGEKKPNAWNLYDMHGNVQQWCADWYSKDYYSQLQSSDPIGAPTGSNRVARGGDWHFSSCACRSAFRLSGEPTSRLHIRGFRVVMENAALVLADKPRDQKTATSTESSVPSTQASAPIAPKTESVIQNPKSEIPAPPPAVAPFDAAKAKEHQAAWAKHLNVQVEITNSIGMKLVLIPPGEFEMGSPKEVIEEELKRAENWYHTVPSEGPRHHVRITRPFYLGETEVTQGEYETVMGKNPSEFSATGKGKDKVAGQDTKRFPVEQVFWRDADEFCRRLSNLSAEKSAGRRYRLPSEAQWEYACRSGSTGRWGFSRELIAPATAEEKKHEESMVSVYGWCGHNNENGMTHAVAGKRANAWGMYDMHGNVWEWCADWYDESYYAKSPTDDPAGPETGSFRVRRGGSWKHLPKYSRSALRSAELAGFRNYDLGFRASLVLADKTEKPTQPPVAGSQSAISNLKSEISGSPPPAVAPFDAKKAK